ncbi:MAG: DUF1573 domain-containing protein [Candidatus Hydrogenedentes bacterium]|nr:DUF1573 domain-containing protein [Candidatus Hydrogenedentota bacterium]
MAWTPAAVAGVLYLAYHGFFLLVNGSPSDVSGFRSTEGLGDYDFGRIREGEIVRHDFLLQNTTLAPLQITNVKTTCGCTLAHDYPSLIPPKSTVRLPVEFRSEGKAGAVDQHVYIGFEGGHPLLRRLVGYVESSHPQSVEFGTILKGTMPSKEFWIQWPPGETLSILDVNYDHSRFEIAHHLQNSEPMKFVFQVTPKQKIGYGPFEEAVLVRTNDSLVPDKKVALKGYVLQPMEVEPAKLAMGLIPVAGKMATVKVYSPYGYPITVDAVKVVEGEPLECSLHPASPSEIAMSVTAAQRPVPSRGHFVRCSK